MNFKIYITATDYRFQIAEWYTPFVRAVQYARINLITRHKIDLEFVDIINPWTAEVRVTLPEGFDLEKFNPGSRLRGISLYLLKNNPELKSYKVGNRLLTYNIKEVS